MSFIMNYNFRQCRICLESGESYKLMPIFDTGSDMARKIYLVTGVQIVEMKSYNVPAFICLRCIKCLGKAWNFRMAAKTAEQHFKRKMFGIETCFWKPHHTSVKPIQPEIASKPEGPEEEFTFTIKTEPEDFVFEPLESAVSQNLEMLMDCPEGAILKFEGKEEEEDVLQENFDQQFNEMFPKSSKTWQCEICSKILTTKNSYLDHMKIKHQEINESEMFKCEYCNKQFKVRNYYLTHMRRVHGAGRKRAATKKVPNKIKTQGIPTKSKPQSKSVEKEIQHCDPCKKVFTTKKSYLNHMKIKHEFVDPENMYVCDHCGKRQILKYYLIRHIQVVHFKIPYKRKNLPEAVPCEICGKIIKDRYTMSQHLQSHKPRSAEDYYYCDLCPRKFKTKGECACHIRERHIYKNTYPCTLCPGVVYFNKWHLKCHIKSKHTNIRDFKCEYCDKSFVDKQKVQIHTRIHTGERPHKCTFAGCSRDFIHQTDLRRHIWGHTGERPYKCSYPNCDKGFMKNSELLHHKNRCHPEDKS